jgi:hypothetical protein
LMNFVAISIRTREENDQDNKPAHPTEETCTETPTPLQDALLYLWRLGLCCSLAARWGSLSLSSSSLS